MSDFRKVFLAFVAVAMFLATGVNAQYGAVNCNTSFTPLSVRGDGLTEATGDIRLECSGTIGGDLSTPPTINLAVTTSTNLTSKLIADPVTDTVLFMSDGLGAEPGAAAQFLCSSANSNCSGYQLVAATNTVSIATPAIVGTGTIAMPQFPAVAAGATNTVNTWLANRTNNTTVTFLNIPLIGAGPGLTRVYRIKNIRVATPAGATSGSILASLQVTGSAFVTVNNATGTIAVINPAMAFARRNGTNGDGVSNSDNTFAGCASRNSDLAGSSTTDTLGTAPTLSLRYREGYQAAFKKRSGAGTVGDPVVNNPNDSNPGVEDGFRFLLGTVRTNANGVIATSAAGTTTIGMNQVGVSDHGTRLRAQFTNVPTGVRIYADVTDAGSPEVAGGAAVARGTVGLTYTAVASDANGANNFNFNVVGTPALNGTALATGGTKRVVEIPVTSNTGTLTWEVTGQAPNVNEDAVIHIHVAFSGNAPGFGTVTVNGTLAPISTTETHSSSAPVQRFRDQANSGQAFVVASCVTNLLFPYVTTEAGFDTGVAISNTSADPFGTTQTSGSCTLNFYGATPNPGPFTTPSISSGSTWRASLGMGGGVPSGGNLTAVMNFTGYIISQCAFRQGHGYAFISDVGVRNVAHGYLALVMTNTTNGNRNGEVGLDN